MKQVCSLKYNINSLKFFDTLSRLQLETSQLFAALAAAVLVLVFIINVVLIVLPLTHTPTAI